VAAAGVVTRIRVIDPSGGRESSRRWFARHARRLPSKVFYPAQADAITRTLSRTRTRAAKRIRAATELPARTVGRRLKLRRASAKPGRCWGALTVWHREAAGARLYVNIDKGKSLGGRALKNRERKAQAKFPGAFMRRGKYSSAVLYTKTAGEMTPQTVDMDMAPGMVLPILQRYVSAYMPRRFQQQARRRLDKELRRAVGLK